MKGDITLTTCTVHKIRPEQHIVFRQIVDMTNNELRRINYSIGNRELTTHIVTYYYSWSLEKSYTCISGDDVPDSLVMDIEDNGDIEIFYPDATLNRLTKATGYDYLSDGQYTTIYVVDNYDRGYIVPKHWVPDVIDESYHEIPYFFDVFYELHKNDIDIEYICGIGIPLTSAIMKIADITVVATSE